MLVLACRNNFFPQGFSSVLSQGKKKEIWEREGGGSGVREGREIMRVEIMRE